MKTFRIILPGSKNISLRALLVAAAANGTSLLKNISSDEEIALLVDELKKLGISVFLNALEKTCEMIGQNDFLLKAHEVTHLNPGVFAGGEIKLTTFFTKDYVWSLFIAAPFAEQPLLIIATDIPNQIAINITCDLMGDFGVLVRRMHQARYLIPVPQQYQAREYMIEPDFAIAAYFFAAAFLQKGELYTQPLDDESKQPEIKFLNVLKKLGAEINFAKEYFYLKSVEHFPGLNLDVREYESVFFPLVVTLVFADSVSTLTNIQNQEDLKLINTVLSKLNIKTEMGSDWLKIYPGTITPANLNDETNPRLCMALRLIALRNIHFTFDNKIVTNYCPEFAAIF